MRHEHTPAVSDLVNKVITIKKLTVQPHYPIKCHHPTTPPGGRIFAVGAPRESGTFLRGFVAWKMTLGQNLLFLFAFTTLLHYGPSAGTIPSKLE